MGTCEANCEIYSPRWGHADTYRFVFEDDGLEIHHGPRKRKAVFTDNLGLTWQGRETLSDIMFNDHIYAPYRIEEMIGHVWTAWHDGSLKADDVQRELDGLAKYINASSQARPRSTFWDGIF